MRSGKGFHSLDKRVVIVQFFIIKMRWMLYQVRVIGRKPTQQA